MVDEPLPESELLFLPAELGVALAGFSAVIGVLGSHRGTSDVRVDALRLEVMLETSLLVAALAIVPELLGRFGIAPPTLMADCECGVLAGADSIGIRLTSTDEKNVGHDPIEIQRQYHQLVLVDRRRFDRARSALESVWRSSQRVLRPGCILPSNDVGSAVHSVRGFDICST